MNHLHDQVINPSTFLCCFMLSCDYCVVCCNPLARLIAVAILLTPHQSHMELDNSPFDDNNNKSNLQQRLPTQTRLSHKQINWRLINWFGRSNINRILSHSIQIDFQTKYFKKSGFDLLSRLISITSVNSNLENANQSDANRKHFSIDSFLIAENGYPHVRPLLRIIWWRVLKAKCHWF